MAWQTNGTPDTLAFTADTLTIPDLTPVKFNVFLSHNLFVTSTTNDWTFNNNTNSVYAQRGSQNGAADSTQVTQPNVKLDLLFASDLFTIHYTFSESGEEKLGMWWQNFGNTAGAGTAPMRQELVYKFVPSPDADITRIDVTNIESGSYDTDSNLSALGTD